MLLSCTVYQALTLCLLFSIQEHIEDQICAIVLLCDGLDTGMREMESPYQCAAGGNSIQLHGLNGHAIEIFV